MSEGTTPKLGPLPVPASLQGERLDRGLALLTGLTRSQAARLVSQGKARLNGRTVTAGSRRLAPGESLEADLAASAEQVARPSSAGPGAASAPVNAQVVHADADVVVVDKPPGVVVHPGAGHRSGTLVDQLLHLYPDIASAGPDSQRPGIVHRIDKGTSGLLMVARTAAARQALVAQLSAHSVDRRYLAVAYGEVEADQGVVDAPLGRSTRERVKVVVVEGGRHARTHYTTLSRSGSPLATSLLSCRLETGRTHQIRAHMAAIGHPVVQDDRYAPTRLLAESRRALPWLERPWLHAAHLGFTHPATGQRLSFSSPLPEDLARSLAVLGLEARSS